MYATFDQAAFVDALERARVARGLSWRQVAIEAELGPSTLYRIVAGSVPDLQRFAALVDWLNLPADAFIHRSKKARFDIVSPDGQYIYVRGSAHDSLTDAQLQKVQNVVAAVIEAMDSE